LTCLVAFFNEENVYVQSISKIILETVFLAVFPRIGFVSKNWKKSLLRDEQFFLVIGHTGYHKKKSGINADFKMLPF
jgi:hypothetical protein